MRGFFLLAVISMFAQTAWAEFKSCDVKVTNPEFNNSILVNQCIEFPGDISGRNYEAAKGLCQPEWDGMNVKVSYTALCSKATFGKCRFRFPVPELNFKYTVYYYSTPMVTLEDNKTTCQEAGGEWLLN